MSTLQAALSLARKGARIFPVASGTKIPAIKSWPILATSDQNRIQAWWSKERFQDANVGVHPVGFLIVDLDGPTAEKGLSVLKEEYSVPDTIEAITGNLAEAHRHLIFKLQKGYRAIPRALDTINEFAAFDKIDIKGSGGYFVGPGSVHKTGGQYRWVKEPESLEEATEAPDWMIEKLCETPDRYQERSDLRDVGCNDEFFDILINRYPIQAGQRHAMTGKAVSYLVGKKLPECRVTEICQRWLNYFRSSFSASLEEASAKLYSTIDNTFKNLSLGLFEAMPDHQAETAKLGLSNSLISLISKLNLSPVSIDSYEAAKHRESIKPVLCSPRGRFSEAELRFLWSLLCHINYMMTNYGRCEEVKMTDRQVISIHEKLFATKLCWKSYYRMKARFITRERAATARELLKMKTVGTHGLPSVYKINPIVLKALN